MSRLVTLFALCVLCFAAVGEASLFGIRTTCANFFCSESHLDVWNFNPTEVIKSVKIGTLATLKSKDIYNIGMTGDYEPSTKTYQLFVVYPNRTGTWYSVNVVTGKISSVNFSSIPQFQSLQYSVGRSLWIGTANSTAYRVTASAVTPVRNMFTNHPGMYNSGVAFLDSVDYVHYLVAINNNGGGSGMPLQYLQIWNLTDGSSRYTAGIAYDAGGSTGAYPIYMTRDYYNNQILGVVGSLLGKDMGDFDPKTNNLTLIWDYRPFATWTDADGCAPTLNDDVPLLAPDCRAFSVEDNTFYQIYLDNTNGNTPSIVGTVRSTCAPGSIHCNKEIWSEFTELSSATMVWWGGLAYVPTAHTV